MSRTVACLSGLRIDGPALITLATALGLLFLLLWILRHEVFPGQTLFVATISGMIWWLGAASLEMASVTLECKTFIAMLTWPAIALVPVAWLLFLLQFCFGRVQSQRALIIILGIVLPISAMALSNPWHGLFYGSQTRLDIIDGRLSGVFDHGPLFFLAMMILNIFIVAAIGVSGAAAFFSTRATRSLFLFLFFISSIPFIANLAYGMLGTTLFGFDPTPYSFAVALTLLTWSIYGNRALNLSTIARDMLYFNNQDPVIVANQLGEIISINPAARSIFPEILIESHCELPEPIKASCESVLKHGIPVSSQTVHIGQKFFDLRALPIPHPCSAQGIYLGLIAVLSDVTDTRKYALRLEETQARLEEKLEVIEKLHEKAEKFALLDPLTSLGNRRSLEIQFQLIRDKPLVLAILDIDHFKNINDGFGHPIGDRVLRDFAELLEELLPQNFLVFRTGGEEFLILCPCAVPSVITRLLKAVATKLAMRPVLRASDIPTVTFSAGLAQSPEDGETLSALEISADARLYKAKQKGRARIVDCNEEMHILNGIASEPVLQAQSEKSAYLITDEEEGA